jgi:ABC-type branched-subunit amino acid transport system ATPase component
VQSLTSSPHFPTILFGLGAINLAKNPDGLFALVGHRRLDRRRARRRRAPVVVPLPVPLPVPVPASTTRAREAPAAIVELPPGTEALRLEGIVAGYGDVEVLHGADLQVPRGQVVALVGANGAGKSTLCAVAAGSVVPTAGRVLLGGADVTALLPHRRARAGLLLVPESRGIFPGLSVQENLELLLRTPEERASVYERFPILGTRRRQLAGVLSGGEQQQLSLAPALTNPPDVLIADEPTLGLSPLVRETIMAAIAELRERGTAILLVEEKAHEALGAADIVAFMRLGRVEWVGRAGEIDEEQLAESYLGAALG